MVKVLFVCLGNICRSPLAEGVLRHKVSGADVGAGFHIDSAGTAHWHVGKSPDSRAQQAARRRGMDVGELCARQLKAEDFADFDHVLVMDRDNFRVAASLCPPEHRQKLRLFMEFAPHLGEEEVPDPYYGGAEDFDSVIDMLEEAADGFLAHLDEGRASG